MTFINRFKFSAFAGLLLVVVLVSCEQDLTTIGSGVIGGEPFSTNKETFDVLAYNKKIKAVRTNKMPLYQLGVFNDPVYGKTEARITSQIQLSTNNPTFGTYSQETEDNSESDDNVLTIKENERIDSVYLYIPFMTNPVGDLDNDGVSDEFDNDSADPNSDEDGDGLTDIQEKVAGTDPFNVDTDGDGINDDVDPETVRNQFAKFVDLDSIYGVSTSEYSTTPFKLKVERSTYFLRDLDPNANFEEAQAYFSTQRFSPNFVSDLLFDGEVTISNEEIRQRKRDDATTEDVDESDEATFLSPGIRVPLDIEFFKQNLIDKEGSSDLLSRANFLNFLRGIHLSATPLSKDIMLLLDIRRANITVSYTYDTVDTKSTTDTADDTIEAKKRDFQLGLLQAQSTGAVLGNAVNTFINEDYPVAVTENLDTGSNASKLYIKGGAGSYAEIKLFNAGDIAEIKAKNWIINEANLVFYVDRASVTSDVVEPPRLYLYNLETGEVLYDVATDPQGNTPLSFYPEYDGVLEELDNKGLKYTVRITKHINDIIIRGEDNATLGLTLTSDIRISSTTNSVLADDSEKDLPVISTLSPLGTVLLGSDPSNLDKKLNLEIFYTETN